MKRNSEELLLLSSANKMAGGSSTSNGDSLQNRICRDFLRNVCQRGKRCKYLHERTDDNPIDVYTFCHDYQNGMCNWPGCKFLHCTENEEKHFRTTGELPQHILNRLKIVNNEKTELPICKDFMKGSCQRNNCKFRHYEKEEPQHNHMIQQHNHINVPTRSQQHFNVNGNNEPRRFEAERK